MKVYKHMKPTKFNIMNRFQSQNLNWKLLNYSRKETWKTKMQYSLKNQYSYLKYRNKNSKKQIGYFMFTSSRQV